mmetsp:Transcript_121631/g.190839  ORF Transcript_121631/g.190839 Transcript_121631/m.190839 type:complete len:336 (+) Transcript_121631:71-1078(+)|eukprot:CAMPEP_0169081066 /NCGR_PEP_ID=MMETSP1015-20121227/10811_1 /TAXON_ID=342587 /ORGANISM="Karlodinium micrum, Strain CCMP2283" /LENGTH=335 /DNA_ID=CAMNT_0009140827 /DNA_START=66 /DNA_END=1073 /DNA_ORIENTATION=+
MEASASKKMMQMVIGFAGIYFFFLLQGQMNEAVVKKGKFKQSWMLVAVEAFASTIFGAIFMVFFKLGGIYSIKDQIKFYGPSGMAQVFAKYLTNASMVYGVSFPVATCAKSAKMVPALIGSIFSLGLKEGSKKVAKPRPWVQTSLVVGGTIILNLAEKSKGGEDSTFGVLLLLLALTCDGGVSFCQEKLRHVMKQNKWDNNFEFQFLTNLYMFLTACIFMVLSGEVQPGLAFLQANPEVLMNLVYLSLASACGQGVIFYVVANLGPSFNACVTTSRKVFSVLLSVYLSGKVLNTQGYTGVGLVAIGVAGEVQEKLQAATAEIKKADNAEKGKKTK